MPNEIPNGDELELAVDRITHSIVTISSDTARRWLEQNKKNRSISAAVVSRYKTDMEQGLWQFAADPIRFDINGHLIDGQHRLTAQSESDVTLPWLVIRGLPLESQGVMDQGRKRTPGQQLELQGIKNSSNVAASIKVLMQWEQGLLFRDNALTARLTAPKITQYVESHPLDVEALQGQMVKIRSIDAAPSVCGAFFIAAHRLSPDDALRFIDQLYSQVGMSEGHPIYTLDRRLRRIRKEGIKTSNRDYLAFLILAWNAWRDGRRMTKFQRPTGGSWSAENFPVVK